jgi:Ni,Fe-hydrogenase III large subunit
VEGDAVQRLAVRILRALLDLDTVRVVGAHFVQRDDVRDHQTQQDQRHGNHVQREEAVQGGVAHHEVAADQDGQVRTDEGNRLRTG